MSFIGFIMFTAILSLVAVGRVVVKSITSLFSKCRQNIQSQSFNYQNSLSAA